MRNWVWIGAVTATAACVAMVLWTSMCLGPVSSGPNTKSVTRAESSAEEPFRPIPCPITPTSVLSGNSYEPIEVLPELHSLPLPTAPEDAPVTPTMEEDKTARYGMPRPDPVSIRMPYADETDNEFAMMLRRVSAWRNELPPRMAPMPHAEESEEPPLFDALPRGQVRCPYRPCTSIR